MKLDVPDTQSPPELTRRLFLGVGVAAAIINLLGCSEGDVGKLTKDQSYSLVQKNPIDPLSRTKSTMKINLRAILFDIYHSKSSLWIRNPEGGVSHRYSFTQEGVSYMVEVGQKIRPKFYLRMTDQKTFDFTFDESSNTITSKYETTLKEVDKNFGKVRNYLKQNECCSHFSKNLKTKYFLL